MAIPEVPIPSASEDTLKRYLRDAISYQSFWGPDMKNFDPKKPHHTGQLRAVLNCYVLYLARNGYDTPENVAWAASQLQQGTGDRVDIVDLVATWCEQQAEGLTKIATEKPEVAKRIAMGPEAYLQEATYWRNTIEPLLQK